MKLARIGAVVLLSAVLSLAVACGSGGGTRSNTPPGTLEVALAAEPPELDPAFSSAAIDRQVMASLYSKLLDIDEEANIVPELARSWEISEDETVYTFELREGVKFHDGTPFNAEAVKFNLERYRKEDSARIDEVSAIENVEAVDPTTVRVTLEQPFSPFLSILTDRAGMMASPAAVKKSDGGRLSQNPVGTGPFKFVERVRGDHITVEKFGGFWRDGLPKLDKVVYTGIADQSVQFQNLRSGEFDVIDSTPYVEIESLQENEDYTVSNEPGFAYRGMYLNVRQPPFDDKKLRQAVYNLMDREAMVQAALRGVGGEPGNSPFGRASFARGVSDEFEEPSVEEAKTLLEEAGKPDGFSFTLTVDPSPFSQQVGQVIQNTLKPAGIRVELNQVEFGALLEQGANGDFEAMFLGWSGRVDPDQNLPYSWVVTDGNFNYSGYSNPEVDRLLDEARRISDQDRRKELYDQVMEILHEDVPYVWFYHLNNIFSFQSNVEGFEAHPDGIIRTASMSKQGE